MCDLCVDDHCDLCGEDPDALYADDMAEEADLREEDRLKQP